MSPFILLKPVAAIRFSKMYPILAHFTSMFNLVCISLQLIWCVLHHIPACDSASSGYWHLAILQRLMWEIGGKHSVLPSGVYPLSKSPPILIPLPEGRPPLLNCNGGINHFMHPLFHWSIEFSLKVVMTSQNTHQFCFKNQKFLVFQECCEKLHVLKFLCHRVIHPHNELFHILQGEKTFPRGYVTSVYNGMLSSP